jgi:hypothetical protein
MRRPRAGDDVTLSARAVPGLRPEALGPPARSSLTVRAVGFTGAKEARCPKGPRLGRPGRPMAAESAARLLEDAAMARREAPALPKGSAENRRNGSALRRTIPSLLGDPGKTGVPGAFTKNTGGGALASSYPSPERGGSAREARRGGVTSKNPHPARIACHRSLTIEYPRQRVATGPARFLL